MQACNDIAAGCKATAPLKTALSRNDLPQRLGRQTVKAKLDAAIVCSIGTDGFTCPNCGKSDSWRHLGTQKNFLRTLNESSAELLRNWDEGTKNGPDRSALLGHNFVYQETKPHGFYSSYFHQRISS